MKNILSLSFALLLSYGATAQILDEEDEVVVTKTPISSEADIKSKLFELPADDANFYFRADLPNDNFVIAQFNKIGYWPNGDGMLKQIATIASSVVDRAGQSFSNKMATHRVDIHLPVKNEPYTVRLKEHNDGSKLVVMEGVQQNPLKIGMDTINVLKTFSVQKSKNSEERVQVQYTFIVKDINDINTIAASDEILQRAEQNFNALVARKRKAWVADNAWYHGMNAEYDEEAGNKKFRTQMTRRFLSDAIGGQVNLGASFLTTGVNPYASIGLNYKWRSKSPSEYNFIGLSLSTLNAVDMQADKNIISYGAVMANIESGAYFKNSQSRIPLHHISAGFGIKIANDPHSLLDNNIYRIFFNYSLSKAITLTPDFYLIQHVGNNSNSQMMGGITLSLRIF
ncbi:MAG: hypothetical protein EOP51_06670 [Sphingobacteriales bacterium]|nr:MAG: hypothetical protein EOP51_06670 [Sphingobacteriales bacterium]